MGSGWRKDKIVSICMVEVCYLFWHYRLFIFTLPLALLSSSTPILHLPSSQQYSLTTSPLHSIFLPSLPFTLDLTPYSSDSHLEVQLSRGTRGHAYTVSTPSLSPPRVMCFTHLPVLTFILEYAPHYAVSTLSLSAAHHINQRASVCTH